ncbi:MAG: SPFH domain-containing protein [Bacteroidetes bacterium]|nr:SPFH domain-containing protein [Bacteroidota bacterium]
MGLFDKIKGEFIDIIEWVDDQNDVLVWKFPRYQNEIKMNAKLTVRESQLAVFMNEGKFADTFGPGLHTLTTQNMPIMTTLKGWKYGFDSPFKADVFYVSTKQFANLKWGTKNPITLNDARFGFVEFRAFGNYSIQISDAIKFLKEISGTNTTYETSLIQDQIRTWVVRKATDALGESNIPIEKVAGNIDELSDLLKEKISPMLDVYGLKLTDFNIENISLPDDLKKEIFKYSRLDKIDMQKLTQFNAANSIELAAQNEGGTAGAGVGMGIGLGVGNMMANAMNQNLQSNNNQQNNSGVNKTPPPPPDGIQYFVSLNGQQNGPMSLSQLTQLVQQGNIKKETFIWKTGMENWIAAEKFDELKSIFTSIPPVPPPIG